MNIWTMFRSLLFVNIIAHTGDLIFIIRLQCILQIDFVVKLQKQRLTVQVTASAIDERRDFFFYILFYIICY